MDNGVGMAATAASETPPPAAIAANRWMPEDESAVHAAAFARTGFQGGLKWFRCHTGPIGRSEIDFFAVRTIDASSCFIAGVAGWGTYRKPGTIDRTRTAACTPMEGINLVEGAGHWVQQEQLDRSNVFLIDGLGATGTGTDERVVLSPASAG